MEANGCQTSTCPTNSDYVSGSHSVSQNRTIHGYVTSSCQCKENYTVWNNGSFHLCKPSCTGSQYRDNSGVCRACNSSSGVESEDDTTRGLLSDTQGSDFQMENSNSTCLTSTI